MSVIVVCKKDICNNSGVGSRGKGWRQIFERVVAMLIMPFVINVSHRRLQERYLQQLAEGGSRGKGWRQILFVLCRAINLLLPSACHAGSLVLGGRQFLDEGGNGLGRHHASMVPFLIACWFFFLAPCSGKSAAAWRAMKTRWK